MVLKVILLTIGGLAILFAGLYITFGFIQNIVDGGNIWLLLLSLPLTGLGGFILYRAGKSNATVMKKNIYQPSVIDGSPSKDAETIAATNLAKNSEMTKQYAKTNDARNRLKLLQAAGESQK